MRPHDRHRSMTVHKLGCFPVGKVGLAIAAVALVWCCDQALSLAAEPGTICFYSSETSVNNYRSLKEEFDSYLATLGPYVFQPFSQRETFENFMRDFLRGKNGAVFVLSSWHYKNLGERSAMNPVLVGRVQDRTTQRRVLSADKSILQVELLKGEKIASAGSEDYTRNLLREMLGPTRSNLVASVSILTVPKDIDALMAVSFKMARAALTTEGSLASLGQINPRQRSQLSLLAEGQETLLPIVVAPAQDDPQVQTLIRILEGMGGTPPGQRLLKMLGFDALQRLADVEKKSLLN